MPRRSYRVIALVLVAALASAIPRRRRETKSIRWWRCGRIECGDFVAQHSCLCGFQADQATQAKNACGITRTPSKRKGADAETQPETQRPVPQVKALIYLTQPIKIIRYMDLERYSAELRHGNYSHSHRERHTQNRDRPVESLLYPSRNVYCCLRRFLEAVARNVGLVGPHILAIRMAEAHIETFDITNLPLNGS